MPRPSLARDRILRRLLDVGGWRPGYGSVRARTTYELAQGLDGTPSWIYQTVNELAEKGWIERSGLRVKDAPALFRWWAERRTEPRVHAFHVADPRRAASELLRLGVPLALTTHYGENAYQGHLFPRRADAYVTLDALPRARSLLVHELDAQLGGTSFRLLSGDDAILEERFIPKPIPATGEAMHYAPLPQVILDLLHEGGSAAEAADMLIQKAYPHARSRLR